MRTAFRRTRGRRLRTPYYFPPVELSARRQAPAQSHPQPQPFHQQYQEPAYRQPGYQQPGYPPAGYQQPLPPQPRYPQPPYAQPEPAAFATIDDAVAQISARQRALDGDPRRSAMPPQRPDAAGELRLRAGDLCAAAIPRPGLCAAALALCRRGLCRGAALRPAAGAGPDLSGLEAHLRNITAQIETLRQPAPDFSGALQRTAPAISPKSALA